MLDSLTTQGGIMYSTDHEREAYRMGVAAAEAAASWCVDGNSDPEGIRRVLAMLDDGDPMAYDLLPQAPNLSGEWADAPTPDTLADEILGDARPVDGAEYVDEITDAWEAGVSATFEQACVRELRAMLPDEDR
jgi:hypothetical protein